MKTTLTIIAVCSVLCLVASDAIWGPARQGTAANYAVMHDMDRDFVRWNTRSNYWMGTIQVYRENADLMFVYHTNGVLEIGDVLITNIIIRTKLKPVSQGYVSNSVPPWWETTFKPATP